MPLSSNSNIFLVIWEKLVWGQIPEGLRRNRTFAWLKVVTLPVRKLYDVFTRYKKEVVYYLNHNSQVVKMEAVLNDRWDNTLRRIVIVDGDDNDPLYIYQMAEQKPKYIYKTSEGQPKYIYKTSETALGGPDFIVEVPIGVIFDINEMKALIDKYRLPSKNYYLIIYV